ncbi:hypothetical protein D3C83_252300 [compost metagenome]
MEQGDLLLEIADHRRRGPSELDDVDVVAGHLDESLGLGQRHALVEDVRQAGLARLR